MARAVVSPVGLHRVLVRAPFSVERGLKAGLGCARTLAGSVSGCGDDGQVDLVACFKHMLCNSRGSNITVLEGQTILHEGYGVQALQLVRYYVIAAISGTRIRYISSIGISFTM